MGIVLLGLAVLTYQAARRAAARAFRVRVTDAEALAALSRPRRAALAAAGPLACYVAAIGVMTVTELLGTERPTLTLDQVVAGKPAAAAGLAPGDVLTAIDGEPLVGWADVTRHVQTAADGEPLGFEVRRGSSHDTVIVTPERAPFGLKVIGITPVMEHVQPGLVAAVAAAHSKPLGTVAVLLLGQAEYRVVGGPVVALSPAQRVQLFTLPFATFALLIALAMLLPLPGFDGALLLLSATRRVDYRWQLAARKWSMRAATLVLVLVALRTIAVDLARL